MRARFHLADALRETKTLDGTAESLSHFRDMMRLCRSDNMGVRDVVPALMLQLDEDQAAYDFIKWYETSGNSPTYDWGDMDLPFLDVKDANVLESPDWLPMEHGDVNFLATLLLLKLKILVDVLNIRLTRKVLAAKAFLPDLWIGVERAIIRSPLSSGLVLKSTAELESLTEEIIDQLKYIGLLLHKANKHVLRGIIDADQWFELTPSSYSAGSREEMQLLLRNSWPAWWQIEGARELVCAANDLARASSVQDAMIWARENGQHRGPSKELVEEYRRENADSPGVWLYMTWAVRDAVSFSKVRPSDVLKQAKEDALRDGDVDDDNSSGSE
jgi:hypothetical protein